MARITAETAVVVAVVHGGAADAAIAPHKAQPRISFGGKNFSVIVTAKVTDVFFFFSTLYFFFSYAFAIFQFHFLLRVCSFFFHSVAFYFVRHFMQVYVFERSCEFATRRANADF